MHRISRVRCICLAIVLHLAAGPNASAQLPQLQLPQLQLPQLQLLQLVTRVPSTANTIAIVNAQAARSGQSAASVIALPEGIEWYLLAAEMDFEYMQPLWEVAVS